MRADQWQAIDALVHERDPYCCGVVLLGLNAPIERLAASFEQASASTTSAKITFFFHALPLGAAVSEFFGFMLMQRTCWQLHRQCGQRR